MSRRAGTALLVLIAVGAWVLRASVFFRVDGVLGWPVDYDEGVYVAASALLWRGAIPYRDFFFAHPPGAPLLFGLFTAWPLLPSTMLSAVRVAMTFVGAANVLVLGLVVRRHAGIVAAALAALLYASHPEAVYAERGAFLEPLLNLACLGLVAGWTSSPPRLRLATIAGSWMLILKSWGVLWLVGAMASARDRKEALRLLAVIFATVCVVLVPTVVFGHFLDQAVLLQLWRPPDGTPERWPRLMAMFFERDSNRITAALTVIGLAGLFVHRKLPIARMGASVLALIVVAFLASSAWWSQYDAHLALAQSLVAGLGCGLLLKDRARVPALALSLALAIPGILSVIRRRHDRDPSQPIRAAAVRELTKGRACAFEPGDLLLGDVLPTALVDPYGEMLLDAVRFGGRYPSADAAFEAEVSQLTLRSQLERCDTVVVGWRGDWQMNPQTRAGFDSSFSLVRDSVFLRK